ncbi:MAG: ATP-dependent sacrificial sulfur transferase LarE [Lachnospiraceae bacterium]|nr:ATP-dependent sacrificial sulfur transferase LarE [Lachnospiraceae bacterium]
MDLVTFFKENPRTAIAFSGGVDSAYLLYAASKYGIQTKAYHVRSAFQPQFEFDDAQRIADFLNIDMTVIEADVLSSAQITANPPERCYFCKKILFSKIMEAAINDGFSLLLDGTNASDDSSERPGMKALKELSVRSPLRECGLAKAEIRRLSKDAGLFTWSKPAYACLATRIPTGVEITAERLSNTERAENFLHSLGFTDFRVRLFGDSAKIQIPELQLDRILKYRKEILQELKKYYSAVLLDLEVRK